MAKVEMARLDKQFLDSVDLSPAQIELMGIMKRSGISATAGNKFLRQVRSMRKEEIPVTIGKLDTKIDKALHTTLSSETNFPRIGTMTVNLPPGCGQETVDVDFVDPKYFVFQLQHRKASELIFAEPR